MRKSERGFSIENCYILLCLLSLIAHVYNSIDIAGIKLFYIPVSICFFVSVFFKVKSDKIDLCLYGMAVMTLLFSLFSYYESSPFNAINLFVLIFTFRKIKYIDLDKLCRWGTYATAIVGITLLKEYGQAESFRFNGWYNDPNYLCLTLLVFAYFNIMVLNKPKVKLSVVLPALNILLITVLIFLTQSRTGLGCLLILLIIFLWDYIKKYLIRGSLVIILAGIFGYNYISSHYYNELDFFMSRFDGRRLDDPRSAANLRYHLSTTGLKYINDNPQYILGGIGIGATDSPEKIPGYPNVENRDHNTYSSSLTEQGLICTILFFFWLFMVFKSLYEIKDRTLRNTNIAFFLSISLFASSVWTMTYLPYWLGLFVVANRKSFA